MSFASKHFTASHRLTPLVAGTLLLFSVSSAWAQCAATLKAFDEGREQDALALLRKAYGEKRSEEEFLSIKSDQAQSGDLEAKSLLKPGRIYKGPPDKSAYARNKELFNKLKERLKSRNNPKTWIRANFQNAYINSYTRTEIFPIEIGREKYYLSFDPTHRIPHFELHDKHGKHIGEVDLALRVWDEDEKDPKKNLDFKKLSPK